MTDIQYRKVSVENTQVREQVLRFSIEESFAGIEGKNVTLTSFANASMCGYPFRKGSRYLVDATYSYGASGSVLRVDSCGGTAIAQDATDAVRFLRTAKHNPHGGIVFGTVKQYVKSSTFVSPNNKPISGASVRLLGAPDSALRAEKREAVVDSTGWYEFVALPEGIYTVIAQVPEGFSGVLEHSIELQRDGCTQVDVRAKRPEEH